MPVPVVAIVGRPNVGKSSLFNWLARKRIAIVDPTAGVTRDRLCTLIKEEDRFFELSDTGGLGIKDVDNLTEDIERQIDAAIEQAAVVLFVVDARDGLTPLDEEVARKLRYIDKPILCVANKCDTENLEQQTAEFYKLGRGKLVCVSTKENRNRHLLLDMILERLPAKTESESTETAIAMKLAIVGRRNTGKSTFINCLAESERVIVSEVPGTTRDSVDVRFERDGQTFIAIDTAGVRRKGSMATDLEFYSLHRAERSIRRADVVLLFHDAAAPISKVDKQLSDYVLEQHKPAVFVVNKWDLMKESSSTAKFGQYVRATFPNLEFVPIAFITALKSKNIQVLLNLAQNLFKQANQRVGTGDLNRILRQAVEQHPPPPRQNRRAKIFFATQVAVAPPTIVLFTNGPELIDATYLRYLTNTFREKLPFRDVPIKLHLRHKRKNEEPPEEREMPKRRAKAEPAAPAMKTKPDDLSQLQFRTELTEEELERESKRYESELWKDL